MSERAGEDVYKRQYIAALIVSFLVLEVGFTFLKDSVSKIRTPETLNFQLISVVILILSIGVKLWLGVFNKKLGKKIDSKVMMAVFTDSMGDVITTSATILSLVIFRPVSYTHLWKLRSRHPQILRHPA